MKDIVITGTSLGLGRELAKAYLEKGYRVFGCSRHAVDETEYGENYYHKITDITSDESVEAFGEWVASKTEKVDILINCAGLLERDIDCDLPDLNVSDLLPMINTNALGPLRVCKAIIPLILKGEDYLIVNITSEAGTIKSDNYYREMYGYCMSKAALNKGSLLVQRYLKPYGVDVLMVHPGWMLTRMGGDDAPIHPSESCEKIVKLIDERTPEMFAEFRMYDYTGKVRNW